MASLVADYGRDEDSDPISDECDQAGQSEPDICNAPVQLEEKIEKEGKNYLIRDIDEASSDSEEESSSEQDDDPSKEKLPSPQVAKLKGPGIGKKKKVKPKQINKSNAVGSVWLNPYENAEMKKQSVLEKHVKMTEVQITAGKKGKICKKFKLTGQCRFGKGCKFSHDIQTIASSQQNQQDKAGSAYPQDLPYDKRSKFPELPPPPTRQGFRGTVDTLHSNSNQRHGTHQQKMFRQQERYINTNQEGEDDDKFLGDRKRKVRVGVSQSLVPPKRALMSLAKQRAEERPWTMD